MAKDNDDINNSPHGSADDALEPAGQLFHPATDEEKLEEDNGTPAAPPKRDKHQIPPDHPITDTGIDEDELYSEGLGEATDVDEMEILPDERPKPLEPKS